MKKILFVLAMCLMFCVNANAQEWSVIETKADELKGTNASTMVIFTDNENGSFCLNFETEGIVMGIQTDKGIFDYDTIGRVRIVKDVIIGFYENDKLIDKITTSFLMRSSKIAATLNGEIIVKVVQHLKHKGEVRFIVERYESSDFDITITMNKELPDVALNN